MKKSSFTSVLLVLALLAADFAILKAQSSSVFDANYFDTEDGKAPPLRVGKGFDITDTYRQTRSCFTPESSAPASLTRQVNSQKTTITLHYTKTESEYRSLRSRGMSGKVSFLNLFSLGGSTLEKFAYTENETVERLVFVARVDFGVFEFGTDPQLSPEAQSLVDQKEYEKFISMYGTHYISGMRKEASVYVILQRVRSSDSEGTEEGKRVEGGLPIPLKGTASFEVGDESKVNKSFAEDNFSIDILMDGPALNKPQLIANIDKVLKSKNGDMVADIKSLISGALSDISDPEQGSISQYYFAPFSLYGVDGIVWNTKKESQLVALNQLVIQAYKAKSKAENYVKPDFLQRNMDEVKGIEQLDGGAEWIQKYKSTYAAVKPKLQKHLADLNLGLTDLEKTYLGCAQIGCDASATCCDFATVNSRVAASAANAEKEMGQLEAVEKEGYNIALAALDEAERPECEKQGFGTVYVKNHSSNPYRLYIGGKLNQTIPGGTTVSVNLGIGEWSIKAEQVSGYLFYATVNNRVANIEEACQQVELKVGFED